MAIVTSSTVKILSVPPNALVMIDGKAEGRTNKKLELKNGSHTIKMRSGDKVAEFDIRVKKGAANKWCYDFGVAKVFNASCPRP